LHSCEKRNFHEKGLYREILIYIELLYKKANEQNLLQELMCKRTSVKVKIIPCKTTSMQENFRKYFLFFSVRDLLSRTSSSETYCAGELPYKRKILRWRTYGKVQNFPSGLTSISNETPEEFRTARIPCQRTSIDAMRNV